ncbi:MAG: tetratricopeptide repeat protein [Opitutales bacterium]
MKHAFATCLLAAATLGAGFSLAHAQADLALTPLPEPEQRLKEAWVARAGIDALRGGLPFIAEGLLAQALRNPQLSPIERWQLQLHRSSALISLGRFDEARTLLEGMGGETTSPAQQLRLAIVATEQGRVDETRAWVEELSPESLPVADRPWFHVLRGLQLQDAGRNKEAAEAFQAARVEVAETRLEPHFEAIIHRIRLIESGAEDADLDELRAKAIAFQGEKAGYEFARLYATALAQRGRKAEALAVLETQMSLLNAQQHEQLGQVLLSHALISGVDTADGRTRLRQLLRTPTERSLLRTALALLFSTRYAAENPDEMRALLGSLIDNAPGQPPHALLDRLLYNRAVLALEAGDLDASEADASVLLERFPGSSLTAPSRRLLAHIALNREPPQFRTAADMLASLRDGLSPGTDRARLGLLVADAYFRNGDYEPAAAAYRLVYEENRGWIDRTLILRQIVRADVLGERPEAARTFLDSIRDRTEIAPDEKWQAEWIYVTYLRDTGRGVAAYERLQRRFQGNGLDGLSPGLKLRLLWLEARLALESDEAERVPYLTENILQALRAVEEDAIDAQLAKRLAANVLLLRGQAWLRLGRPENGLAQFADLRAKYPDTRPAMLSFLAEAHELALAGRLGEAQQRLGELAAAHPESDLAPKALFEAAINAQQRGLSQTHQEALRLLDQLAQDYPDNPLVFEARLRQGNILRDLGQFGDALNVYENLLVSFPQHPQRYRAEFGRAYCLALDANGQPERVEGAAAAFERLFDLPQIPIDARVEAGHQAGRVLSEAGQRDRAAEVYWLVITRFLDEPELAESLGVNGRYWMSRNLFDLAALLEQKGETAAAHQLYGRILASGLPGASLAEARRNGLLPEPVPAFPETAALP